MAVANSKLPEFEEEAQGLVNDSNIQRPAPPSTSAKWQILTAFVATSIFMLMVGFVLGKQIVASGELPITHPPSTITTKITKQDTEPPSIEKQGEDAPNILFDTVKLEEAKTQAIESIKLLENYWGEDASKVLTGDVGFTFGFSGPDKAPTNPESFKRTVDIIARVLVHQEPLTLGFIGSSVMCGHDNCYYDSFPEQLRRFIGPIFQVASGKPVDFRNGCQGGTCGDSYENQIFCFRHMVGDDIDMLFYEWTYFENRDAHIYHESITRWATLLPKVPSTIIINCDKDAWGRKGLPERYAKFGVNGINLEEGLKAGSYKGKVWGAIGDGRHTTTRYGEASDVSEARRKSLGVVFRNWHPGPLGLQYVSDLTSYLLLRAFIVAVDQINADPNGAAKKWPQEPFNVGDLPPVFFPKEMKPEMYDLASLNEEPPGCYTIQRSTFGKPQPVIADRNEDRLNPYRESVKKLGADNEAWTIWNAPANWAMVPREERGMGDMCRPPDNCAYFVEPQDAASKTPFVFRLPKMSIGLIAICGHGGDAGKKLLENKKQFTVEFDGKVLDSSKYTVFPHTKCLALQMAFSGPVENKFGHLYLSITTRIPLQISQLITA